MFNEFDIHEAYKFLKEKYKTSNIKELQAPLSCVCRSKQSKIQNYFKVNYKITNRAFLCLMVMKIEELLNI